MTPTTADAYELLHRGSLALARASHNGARVDVGYLKQKRIEVDREMRALTKELKADKVWKVWKGRFGDGAKLGSRPQLAAVFYEELGLPVRERTEKGQPSTEESAFRGVPLPFVKSYFRLAKLAKVRSTYLDGILREVCGEYLHPDFNLHTVQTYRGSSSDINFQNIPVRDPEVGKLIRSGFIPRRGRRIVETDLSGAEVRVAYCYHLDPTMRAYLLDPKSDMHGDTACELFMLPPEFVRENAAWAKKTVRDWAKNRFVFPQFYGSVYFQCAPHLWEAVVPCKLPDGAALVEHLAARGVTGLGQCSPKASPAPGTFEQHVRRVEQSFWSDRFPVYTAWKERRLREYLERGHFDLATGFRCAGVYRRNQVINYPVQGAAFHVLLWSLVKLQDWLDRHGFKALIIGQIHDSIIADVPDDEVQDYLTAVRHFVTVACPRHWPWITIPLEIEAEVCEPGASWATKKVWKDKGGVWTAA